MSSSESFSIHDISPSEKDEVDSLPSISSGLLDSEADLDAQAEWERSLEQLQLLLTMIIVPFAGKYFGRKFAYWSMFYPTPYLLPPEPGIMDTDGYCVGWARYMEWAHNVDVRVTSKKAFNVTGAVEAAASL